MYTHQDIERMLKEEYQKAIEAGVPVSKKINPNMEFPKARSFFGQCRPERSNPQGYKFTIRFSEYFLEGKEKSVRNTLMHELLHTCPDCMNHGKVWQKWAGIINAKYGYHIQRVNGDKLGYSLSEHAPQRAASNKPVTIYKLKCAKCGYVWSRTRRSQFTMHPENYTCCCGGSIKAI